MYIEERLLNSQKLAFQTSVCKIENKRSVAACFFPAIMKSVGEVWLYTHTEIMFYTCSMSFSCLCNVTSICYHYPIFNFTTDLMLIRMKLDKEKENNLNLCNDMHIMDKNAMYKYHQTLQNRLNVLQEYIPFPANYSETFDNPCWYDFHQKPTSMTFECISTAVHYTPSVVKQTLNQVQKSSERHLYCLPAFFLIGFPKCATTTLYKMIIRHPLMADNKCLINQNHFWPKFANKHGTDLDKRMQTLHYLNYFSQSIPTIESNPKRKILDHSACSLVSTTWTTTPYTTDLEFCILPSLFMRVLPEAKYIVIMRNPTERTFSHYYHYSVMRANKGIDSRGIDTSEVFKNFHKHSVKVILKFQSCVDGGHSVFHCVREKMIDGKSMDSDGQVGIQTSLYYYHIVPWLSVIPRERFLFLRTEDLAHNPDLTMTEVWHFLHLTEFPSSVKVFENVNREADGLKIHPQTKHLLDNFFWPHNQLLARLLSDKRYLWNN